MNRFLKPIFPSLFVLLVVLFALPQNTITNTVVSSILVLFWNYSIFILGIPSWRDSISDLCGKITPQFTILMIMILPYTLLVLTGITGLETILLFIFYYLIPSLLFFLPELMRKRIPLRFAEAIPMFSNVVAAGILWIGFDHRHTTVLFDGYEDMGYVMNALWVASVIMTSYGRRSGIRDTNNPKDTGLKPAFYGAKIGNITSLAASVIIVPIGLITGFLLWNPVEFDLANIIVSFIGIYLTISLQEELIFRGVLLKELSSFQSFNQNKTYKYGVLIFVSILFALTHWNNETPEFVYHYFAVAFIAGLAYGVAYQKGGMFAAMLSHTLVDWIWALLLKRV